MRDYDLLHILRGRLRSNLKWAMQYYNFTDDEMYVPYGNMSFEQKHLRSGDCSLDQENAEFCEPRYLRSAVEEVPVEKPASTSPT